MKTSAFEQRVASVRRFNRLYTQPIGVLDEGLLDTRFGVLEQRPKVRLPAGRRVIGDRRKLPRAPSQPLGLVLEDGNFLAELAIRFGTNCSCGLLNCRSTRAHGRLGFGETSADLNFGCLSDSELTSTSFGCGHRLDLGRFVALEYRGTQAGQPRPQTGRCLASKLLEVAF